MMRSRSSSPNTPSSDSSPSSSDLPLAVPSIVPEVQKELEETTLFNAFINDSAFDSTSPVVAAPAGAHYERLHSVLSSTYHVPPPLHTHVLPRPPASVPEPDEPEQQPQPQQEPSQIVTPPKENCINLPIRVRNVPLQGAKSRVETQLKVTIDLVWDQRFGHHPQTVSAYPNINPAAPTVGSWEYLALPTGSATKRRGRKDAKIAPTPEQTLTLHTMVNVASPPNTAARACKKCLAREAKRAERKRRGPNDPEPAPLEPGVGLEDDKIVLYNCSDVLEFKTGTVDLPVRLTCYCRHHSEKVGFRITFILRDHTGRTVGTGVTPPILITDDHKSTARKVQVQAQAQQQPDVTARKKKQHRMPKPYARSTGTSRASSLGLGGVVKEEAVANGFNGTSSYGSPSTQGYTSPPPQSPAQFNGTTSGMFAMLSGDGFQLGDGIVPLSAPAFLSPPRSPVQSRIHTRPQTPGSRIHSPVQTRVHSRVHSPVQTRSHSPARTGLDGVLGGLELSALMNADPAFLGSGNGLDLGLGGQDLGLGGQFTPADTQMLEEPFDPSTIWESTFQDLAGPRTQPAMYVEHPASWEPATASWVPESMDLSLPDPTPIPRVSRVVPNSGPVQGGIEVTLLGENFTRSYEVKFGDYVATETAIWGANTLVCLLPPAAQPGVVPVVIKEYEHLPRTSGEREVVFTYKDDSVDRSLMELALRVVGQRMTGRQEEPCNIARRIVAVGEMQSSPTNSNVLATRLAQSVIESTDATPGPTRQEELVQFLTLLDIPNVGSRTVSTRTAVSLQNETGHTLLHLCAVLGYDALTTDLLARGADPDVRDATGQTPLHLAALRGQTLCARVLLRGGADVDIVNSCGMAPVDVARERGNMDIVGLLERSEEEEEEEEEVLLEETAADDSTGVEGDVSDYDEGRSADADSEGDAASSCSDTASGDDLYAEQPPRPSLDSIADVRPPFLGDVTKVPSTWFHRTFTQKGWPLGQINLPDIPALPAWPVTIPWPQTPEKGAFDLAAFRGFLGAKQEQQPVVRAATTYPPPPQPEAAAPGMSDVQLRARLARRLGYYPTEVTEREVRAYTHHSQKMRKLKKDRMLVLFWLPILLIVIAWGLYQSVPIAIHTVVHTVKQLLPLAGR